MTGIVNTGKIRVSRWFGERFLLACIASLLLSACEAPLNLEGVTAEDARQIHRYDVFQAAAVYAERVVVVSSMGTSLVSDDSGATWKRQELPGRPQLIDVTVCDSGDFYALDSSHQVWQLAAGVESWVSSTLDTQENTLSIECAPGGRVWVSASFSTLYSRDQGSTDWREFTLNEDLQFTTVSFVDALHGFAVGEFGTVISTIDGGKTWTMQEPLPNEFYPMSADFLDAARGWVGGLGGVIWKTEDGGQSWHRQLSLNTAPVYNLLAGANGVYAVGGSGKLVKYIGDEWQRVPGAPEMLSYLRALVVLQDGSLIVAGGGGVLSSVSNRPKGS